MKYPSYLMIGLLTLCFFLGCGAPQQEGGYGSEPKPRDASATSPNSQKSTAEALTPEKGYAKEVLPLYIDCAKVFSQMAIGALGLTIVFKEKVIGATGPMRVGRLLMATWICFLISIGAGLSYQWLAIRLISLKDGYERAYFPLNFGLFWPGNVFGGAMMLVATSIIQLKAQASGQEVRKSV